MANSSDRGNAAGANRFQKTAPEIAKSKTTNNFKMKFSGLICYVRTMSDQDENNALRRRVIALEHEVRTIHSQLDDIRKIFSSAYDLLSNSNRSSSRSIGCLARHIEEIEERLDPTFNKTFPHQSEFISETQAIFDGARKRSS